MKGYSPTYDLIRRLSSRNVKLNATCIMTVNQLKCAAESMRDCECGYISVFAGRIADTDVDPVPLFVKGKEILANNNKLCLLWASSREVFNIIQADAAGCDAITLAYPLIRKLSLIGKDLVPYWTYLLINRLVCPSTLNKIPSSQANRAP